MFGLDHQLVRRNHAPELDQRLVERLPELEPSKIARHGELHRLVAVVDVEPRVLATQPII